MQHMNYEEAFIRLKIMIGIFLFSLLKHLAKIYV